jgi:outer membrane protein assembly factor BamB
MNSAKVGYSLFAFFVCTCAFAAGADWLSKRGDPQQTGWQKEEKVLTVRTVKGLRLLWKQRFNVERGGLSDPLILGPIITHRGIKELVFVKSGSNTVYAVDADLGTIFWSRNLGESVRGASASKSLCAENIGIMPAMAPGDDKTEPSATDDDDFSDGNRPLYVLSADGHLHALRPSTGGDFSASLRFPPLEARPVSLGIADRVLHITTSPVCGGVPDRIWIVELNASGVPLGSDLQSRPLQKNSVFISSSYAVFKWNNRDLLAELTGDGRLLLQNAKDVHSLFESTAPQSARSGGLATWQDAADTRWIVATSTAGVKAFQVTGPKNRPVVITSWTSHNATAAGPPVVANDVLYFLSSAARGESSHLTLHAVNALNGEDLYTSGNLITSGSSSGNIAIANGHVCFSTTDGTLYCFGLPFEM